MLQGSLPVTNDQIFRLLTPVLTDNNNSLLHHFSYNYFERLKAILEMSSFQDYYKTQKKMFPIFYNFFGQSQISIALQAN